MAKKKKTKKGRCKRCNRSCNGKFCSQDCEIKFLRSKLSDADRKLARRKEEKQRPIQCLGRVEWKWCCQEWYLKDSYDAKRRACELRHQGFECSAKSVGEMPLDDGHGWIRIVKVTVLTAHCQTDAKGDTWYPPEPAELVAGLGR